MMIVRGFSSLLLALFLVVGTGIPFSSAAEMVPLSDQELDEVVAGGLFFEINLRDGIMRMEIFTGLQSLDNVTANNTGALTLGGNALQNAHILGNSIGVNSQINTLINILVLKVQGGFSGVINQVQVGLNTRTF